MDKQRSFLLFIDVWKEKIQGDGITEILRDWKMILSYSRRYLWQIVVFTVFGIAMTSFGLLSSVANKWMIDIVINRTTEKMWMVVAIWIGTNILSLALQAFNSRFSTLVGTAIRVDIRRDVFGSLLGADWQSLRHYSGGDMLDRINNDVETVAGNAIVWIPNTLVALYSFGATFLLIWHYSKGMAAIGLAAAPLLFLAGHSFILREREYQKQGRTLSSGMYSFETQAFEHIEDIKSLDATDLFQENFFDKQGELRGFHLERNAFQIKKRMLMRVMRMLVTGAAFAYALWLLWSDHITYGTMVLFLQQRSRLTQAVLNVGHIIPGFVYSSVSAGRLNEVLRLPAEKESAAHGTGEKTQVQGEWTLRVRDVEVPYAEGKTVLARGEMTVRPGEIVALMGPSGCGKTTLLRLALGLLTAEAGRCSLMPENAREEALPAGADTRAWFSYVPQTGSLFSGTIRENLTLSAKEASEEELWEALWEADARDFVENMPEGLDTVLREGGHGLSQGQTQRVAIARALLKPAPILLLDEATGALDMATEERVMERLREHLGRRSCLITTHRPAVLSYCDRVYRIEGNEIVEATISPNLKTRGTKG